MRHTGSTIRDAEAGGGAAAESRARMRAYAGARR